MGRIAEQLARCAEARRAALVPYLTAGDPYPQVTVKLMHAMVASGADIIELGVPFSDPMADGPTIQRAIEHALAHDISIEQIMAMVAEFRQQDQTTPIVLMGYLNPIESMGYAHFAEQCRVVGVDGVLLVDLPPEEAEPLMTLFKAADVDPIFLMAPTTTEQRIEKIAAHASGYIYYVSLKGITGANELDLTEVESRLALIRQHTQVPIAVGFGIKTPERAAQVAQAADGVVVGSALVGRLHEVAQAQGVVEGQVPEQLEAVSAHLCEAISEQVTQLAQAMPRATDAPPAVHSSAN